MIPILVITFAEQTLSNAARPMVAFRVLDISGDLGSLSLVIFCFAFASLLASWLGGPVISRIGPRLVLLVGACGMVGGVILLLTSPSMAGLAASQALMGFGQSAVVLSSQSLLARFHPGSDRGYGAYSAAASIGQVTGPLIATLMLSVTAGGTSQTSSGPDLVRAVQYVGWVGLGLSVLLFAGIAALPRLAYRSVEQPVTRHRTRTVLLDATLRRGVAVSAMLSLSLELVVMYLPALGVELGWPSAFVGVLLAIRAGAGIVARMLTAPLLRILQRTRLIGLSLGIPAVSLLAVPILGRYIEHNTGAVIAVIVVTTMFGFWNAVGVPVTMVWVASSVPSSQQAIALGIRLTANRLGQTVMPVTIGALGGVLAVSAVFWGLSGLLVAALGLFRYSNAKTLQRETEG